MSRERKYVKKASISYQAVASVATQLVKLGRLPTNEAVTAYFGQDSQDVVVTHLGRWKEERSKNALLKQ